jgi:general stress protein YciG
LAKKKGFAAMSPEKQKEIASKGGKSLSLEVRKEIGRKGGLARAEKLRKNSMLLAQRVEEPGELAQLPEATNGLPVFVAKKEEALTVEQASTILAQ